jgi:hypothetical protein
MWQGVLHEMRLRRTAFSFSSAASLAACSFSSQACSFRAAVFSIREATAVRIGQKLVGKKKSKFFFQILTHAP